VATPSVASHPLFRAVLFVGAVVGVAVVGSIVWRSRRVRQPRRQDYGFVRDDSPVPRDFWVAYHTAGGMAGPPVELIIDATGAATLHRWGRSEVIATLSPSDMATLWHLVAGYSFFRWRDPPPVRVRPPLFGTVVRSETAGSPPEIAVTAGGRANDVQCGNLCPRGWKEIEDFLYQRTELEKWIHGGPSFPSPSAASSR
jgi:hypothetical protein